MTSPGNWLRRQALRVFDAATMERVIDPVIADMQAEFEHAVRQGRVWKSRQVRLAGMISLVKVAALHACRGPGRVVRDWTPDDHRALTRTIGFIGVNLAIAIALQLVQPFSMYAWRVGRVELIAYFIPAAFLVAVPQGLMLGVAFGLRTRASSHRLKAAIVALAAVCSLALLTMQEWVLPEANQAFRVSMSGNPALSRGEGEIKIRDLGPRIEALRGSGPSRQLSRLRFNYHLRWALPFSSLVLTLFALSVTARRTPGRFTLGAGIVAAFLAYFALLALGKSAALSGTLPAFLGAWLPSIVFLGVSATLATRFTLTETRAGP